MSFWANRKVRVVIVTAALAILLAPVALYLLFDLSVSMSLRSQGAEHDAVKPRLRAIASKLKTRDSLAHVEEVLRSEKMEYYVERRLRPQATLSFGVHTSAGSGVTMDVKLDSSDRVEKIEEHEYFLGP